MHDIIGCQFTFLPLRNNRATAASQTDKQQWVMSLFIQNSALNVTRARTRGVIYPAAPFIHFQV